MPILKTVFDALYADEYHQNGNFINMNGAKYVRLDGVSSIDDA